MKTTTKIFLKVGLCRMDLTKTAAGDRDKLDIADFAKDIDDYSEEEKEHHSHKSRPVRKI